MSFGRFVVYNGFVFSDPFFLSLHTLSHSSTPIVVESRDIRVDLKVCDFARGMKNTQKLQTNQDKCLVCIAVKCWHDSNYAHTYDVLYPLSGSLIPLCHHHFFSVCPSNTQTKPFSPHRFGKVSICLYVLFALFQCDFYAHHLFA